MNDSNLGTKQANVISSGSTSLNMKLFRKSNSTSAIWTSSVATGGGKRGQLPPSLSKTVSEIRPDPLRFIFEGWGGGIPLDLDLPAAGLLFCFLFCKT